MVDGDALYGVLTCGNVMTRDGESSHSTRVVELLMRFGFTPIRGSNPRSSATPTGTSSKISISDEVPVAFQMSVFPQLVCTWCAWDVGGVRFVPGPGRVLALSGLVTLRFAAPGGGAGQQGPGRARPPADPRGPADGGPVRHRHAPTTPPPSSGGEPFVQASRRPPVFMNVRRTGRGPRRRDPCASPPTS